MDVSINWVAVGLATLSAMLIGSIWYAKSIFGNLWIKLAKLDPKTMQKNPVRPIVVALIMAFFTAYVIAHVAYLSKQFFNYGDVTTGVMTAFWLWLGISATTVITHDVFESRPVTLTLLTIGNQFFTMMLMGLIIGLFGF